MLQHLKAEMGFNLVILVALAFVTCIDAQDSDTPVEGMFNCLRYGHNCDNEATCVEATGLCTCPNGFQGYDCSINSSLIVTEDCNCEKGGTCVSDDQDNVMCYCPDSHYGDTCQNERVEHTCFHDSIEIKITPFNNMGGFIGSIYVLDNPTPECSLKNDGTGTYSNSIMLEDCGGAINDTLPDGNTELSFTFLVQYDDLIVTANDQEFVAKCVVKQSDSNVEWEDNLVSSDDKDRPLQKQEVSEELLPVDLSLLTENDEVVATPQKIGTNLKLVFQLNGGNVYDSFQIVRITANNGMEGSSEAPLDFVTDGCVTERAGPSGKKIVTNFEGDGTSRVELTFKLFKFRLSNRVAFKNVVKLCKGTGGCNATECDHFEGLGRRRRSIEDDYALDYEDESSKYESLEGPGIIVWIPGEKKITAVPQLLQKEGLSLHKPGLCFRNIWFIICIVALVLAFSLAGALIAVICIYKCKKNSSKLDVTPVNGFDNKGYNVQI